VDEEAVRDVQRESGLIVPRRKPWLENPPLLTRFPRPPLPRPPLPPTRQKQQHASWLLLQQPNSHPLLALPHHPHPSQAEGLGVLP